MIIASLIVYQVEVSNNKSYTVKLRSVISLWESRDLDLDTIDIICTCYYVSDYAILCKYTIVVLREIGEDLNSYYDITTWYSTTIYRNTYSHLIAYTIKRLQRHSAIS